jgi:hypothetical protein
MRCSHARLAAFTAAALLIVPAGIQPAAAVDPHGPARNSTSIKLGVFVPEGDSERWEFNEDVLNSDTDEFDDWALALEYNRQLTNYLAASAELMFYSGEDRSHFHLGFDDFRQDTELDLLPAMASILWQPAGKYRSGGDGYPGRMRTVVPYLGAGVGLVLWEYKTRVQMYSPSHRHYHHLHRDRSEGAAPAAMALLGVEIPLVGAVALVVEGRYLWADDDVEDDFFGVEDLDFSGASLLIGGAFRF